MTIEDYLEGIRHLQHAKDHIMISLGTGLRRETGEVKLLNQAMLDVMFDAWRNCEQRR